MKKYVICGLALLLVISVPACSPLVGGNVPTAKGDPALERAVAHNVSADWVPVTREAPPGSPPVLIWVYILPRDTSSVEAGKITMGIAEEAGFAFARQEVETMDIGAAVIAYYRRDDGSELKVSIVAVTAQPSYMLVSIWLCPCD